MNIKIKRMAKAYTRRGFITAYALGASALIAIILSGMVIFISSNQRKSFDESAKQQAMQAAESGIYFYNWYLAHNLNGKNIAQIRDFWNTNPLGVNSPYEQDVVNFEGTAYGRYRVEVTPPATNSTIITIQATGWTYRHPEITRSIKVRFRRPSWSEYAFMGNDVMRFGDGTTVQGPLHSNNGIQFDGVAHNKVTSSVSSYRDPVTGLTKPGVWTSKSNPDDVFLAGTKYPVPAVDFSGMTADFVDVKAQAQSGGIYLGDQYHAETTCKWVHGNSKCGCNCWCQQCETEQLLIEGYHLTLRTDDMVEIRQVLDYQGNTSGELNHKSYAIEEETEPVIMPLPANGIIFVENSVWVDGQINTAQISIIASRLDSSEPTNIYIVDDILYTNKDGSDVIGLVAEDDITIGLYSQNDLEIDAALLAQNGRVGREAYNLGHSTNYYKRDKVTIYGAIASNKQYGFSYVDQNGTRVSGYAVRNIIFDNHLLYTPPPFFPTFPTYEYDLWEEE